MAGSVNKLIQVGNLVKDPEVRTTQDGQNVPATDLRHNFAARSRPTRPR
jgi:single-stranded DNA-binding protein